MAIEWHRPSDRRRLNALWRAAAHRRPPESWRVAQVNIYARCVKCGWTHRVSSTCPSHSHRVYLLLTGGGGPTRVAADAAENAAIVNYKESKGAE